MKKKLTARRAAAFVASAGMLVMSSGVALMVTAAPAEAANKVGICHATNSDTNPYTWNEVDDDSVKLKGHLEHRNSPNKIWKTAGTFNGVDHVANQPKPDIIGSFTDDQGVFHEMDGNVTEATCKSQTPPEVLVAIADVEFQDPDCDNENTADFDVQVDNATWEITDGEVGPGKSIEITFAANEGAAFEDGAQTVFSHTFGEEEICDIVLPPEEVTPVAPAFGEPDCETAPSVTLPDPAPVTDLPEIERSAAVIETKDVDGVHYVVEGDLVPGGTVTVDATALEGFVIAEGAQTHWEHTFANVEDCEAVQPPPTDVDTPETPDTTVATPTVVHAGLTDAADLRGEQGLALLVVGMIMMVFAGGLGLKKSEIQG